MNSYKAKLKLVECFAHHIDWYINLEYDKL